MVKIWLQHRENPNIRGNSQQETSIDGARQGQGSQKMENANENQGSRKLLRICKFLSEVHSELQSYSKTIKQPKRKEEMEMERRTSTSFQWAKRQDYKLTGTLSSKKREKIQSGNGCLRTCHWRDVISRTGREMETNSLPIQDNVTSKNKLRNLWQRATSNCRNLSKVETISTGHNGTIQNLNGSQKPQVFQRTS